MIDFGTYKYIGTVDKNKSQDSYRYNDSYYKSLLSDNRFQDAADYMSNFVLADKDANAKLRNDIETFRSHGKLIEAVYSKIEDPAMLRRIEEADNIGVPGGYFRLRNKKDASGNLLYKTDEEFFDAYPMMKRQQDLLRSIGSTKDKEATSYSLTFSNKKYGLFGIDEFKEDNDDNLEYFLQGMGVNSITELKNKIGFENVKIDDKTGETTVFIDKNNDYAMQALMSIKYQDRDENMVTIKGYDKNGEIDREVHSNFMDFFESSLLGTPETISNSINRDFLGGKGSMFLKQKYSHTSVGDVNQAVAFANDVYRAQQEKYELFKKSEANKLLVTTSTFDITDDRLEYLKEANARGELSDSQYNKFREEDIANWVSRLRNLPYVPGLMSNINRDDKDNAFYNIKQEDYQAIQDELSHYKDNEVNISGMILDGEIGILMNLPQLDNTKNPTTNTDYKTTLFIPASAIPGALGQLQQRINNDTHLKAEKDYSDMINWRVKHKLLDGTKIYTDGNRVIKEKNGVKSYSTSPDDIIRDLDRDIILRQAQYIKYNYIGRDGNLNYNRYEQTLANAMIAALYDLYPNTRFADINGNELGRDISYNILFDNNNELFGNSNNYTEPIYNAMLDIKNMYNYLLNEATVYTQNNK